MADSDRFIKFIPSQEAMFLVTNKKPAYQNAFRLLTIIAERARRYDGHPDGLKIGECHLGNWESYGMSEQNYKSAKKILERMGQIKIIETNRTRKKRQLTESISFNSTFSKKATTKVTTEGTLVQLCSSTIYDINPEVSNDSSNVQVTTGQRLGNDKLRKNKKDISNDISNKEEAQPAAQLRSKDSLSFNFQTWKFEGISEDDMANWKIAYPHVELQAEIIKATEWLKSHPNKSNKSLWRKFLTGWFERANDSIENKKAYRRASGTNAQDRSTRDINGNPVPNAYEGKF